METVSKVEVLVDPKAGDLSIIAVDDTDGCSVETTLSVEEAGALVSDLMVAIQKIKTASEIQGTKVSTPVIKQPTVVHTQHFNIDARGSSPERVRDAVLEAIGADRVRKERYSKPGFPATISKTGLREYIEPTEQVG